MLGIGAAATFEMPQLESYHLKITQPKFRHSREGEASVKVGFRGKRPFKAHFVGTSG